MRILPVAVGIIAALFVLFGILGTQTIAGGGGWYSQEQIYNPPENTLCYGTPITMTVPFTRLTSTESYVLNNDAQTFDPQSYNLYSNTDAGLLVVGTVPGINLLSGSASFIPPGTDLFAYPIGSKADWTVKFSVDQSVTSGYCGGGNALSGGGCAIGFDACVRVNSQDGNQFCDGVSGTGAFGSTRFGKTFYFYPAAYFADKGGCPKEQLASVLPIPDEPVVGLPDQSIPESVDDVISAVTPSQTNSQTVKILVSLGVGVLAWYLARRYLV